MMSFKAVKKPIEIEAIHWTGFNTGQLLDFCKDAIEQEDHFIIKTLEGDMKLTVGNVLIKGINGEFYPCDFEIFMKTYEVLL